MYLGRVVEIAPTEDIYYRPKHPYTEALMAAIPLADPEAPRQPVPLAGERPDPANPPRGCRFHTRCRHAVELCRVAEPMLAEQTPGHFAACHRTAELRLTGALTAADTAVTH
jgi:peptide/nickel transport system ATP-binding protein